MTFSYHIAAIVLLALASNVSSACPIWRCAVACTLEPNNGGLQYTCNACMPTYKMPSPKRACACPAGTVETTSGTCTKCPVGSYCPAGTGNGATSALGTTGTGGSIGTTVPIAAFTGNATGIRSNRISCGLNMTTKFTASQAETSCVTSPGFYYAGPGKDAIPCPLNTYNPGGNRLKACYTCPSGLVTTTTGCTSKLSCLVPAGYIMNKGMVTPCPKGTFREGLSLPNAQMSCTPCAKGWTTATVASTTFADCARTLPGFFSSLGNQGSSLGTPAIPCPVGYWSKEAPGGMPCIKCAYGWTTKNLTLDTDGLLLGYTSASACANPPGWYSNSSGVAEKCPNGTYAAGWAQRKACTSCGTNIYSAPNTVDETDGSSTVRTSPDECYILPGYGMKFNKSSKLYTSTICATNTYGSYELTYGLKFVPCTPCAKGLITPGPGMISKDNCTNTAGWGWNGFTAEICAAGSWAPANSLLSCTECPPGRSTTSITPGQFSSGVPYFSDDVNDLPLPHNTGTDQENETDCKVLPGYGVVNETDISAFTVAQKVALVVQVCPLGTFGTGGDQGSLCTPCASTPGGGQGGLGPFSDTAQESSTNVTDCNICLAGYGTSAYSYAAMNTLCTGCLDGFYQTGTGTTCTPCGTVPPYGYPGKTELITVNVTTNPGNMTSPGAGSTDECYPAAWQLAVGSHLVNTSGLPLFGGSPPAGSQRDALAPVTASQCVDNCIYSYSCIGALWIYTNIQDIAINNGDGMCLQYIANPVAFPGLELYVKVLTMEYASTGRRLMKVRGTMVASGSYVKYTNTVANLGLTISNTTSTTLPDCKDACDNNVECWGFYYSGFCVLRKSFVSLGHRSFMHVIGYRVE